MNTTLICNIFITALVMDMCMDILGKAITVILLQLGFQTNNLLSLGILYMN